MKQLHGTRKRNKFCLSKFLARGNEKCAFYTFGFFLLLFLLQDANESDIKVQVCVFMFDLLYFNGEPLVKKPFVERRALLRKYFKEVEGEWAFANHLDTTTMEEVQEYLEESVKGI